jgi:hypothetical protein
VPHRSKIWITGGTEQNDTGEMRALVSSIAAATLGALWAGIVVCGLWDVWVFTTTYSEPMGLSVLAVVEAAVSCVGWLGPVV